MSWLINFRVDVCNDTDDDLCWLDGEFILEAPSIDEALVKARNHVSKLTSKEMSITKIEYICNGD